LQAFAGEPINCNVAVAGYYTSIDWDAASIDGHATNFVASFPLRRTPWTVRLQVNWGGNPVIKYVSVTTLAGGCFPQPGSQVCVYP
jgi:hypothetical protein